MDQTKLIEYTDDWAAAVSDMWNESAEGWNNEQFNKTPERVKQEQKTLGALHTFLIVEGERALGYCSLLQASNEKDALYIGMLNVRPEHHGRKLGKRLVLAAVEATCKHGRSRLYLHTWTGNTKAVPLYKKTGFFWMDKDQSTHLVNYIPMVLRDEVIAHELEGYDWYADSTRELEVKPDGVKKNHFEIYTYSWEKADRKLEIDFTRYGRGVRRIESDDWSVELNAPDRRLVFGREFEATFTVRSKSGEPLDIRIEGMDDAPVRFSMNETATVTGEQTFTGAFKIDPIEQYIEEAKTPSVKAKVTINGRTTEFRLGVSVCFPASANIMSTQKLHRSGCEADGFLNVSNSGQHAVELEITLPDSDDVKFINNSFKQRIEPDGDYSLPVRFKLVRPTMYYEQVEALVRFEDTGEEVRFKLPVTTTLNGWTGSIMRSSPYSHTITQGPWSLDLFRFKSKNEFMLHHSALPVNSLDMFVMAPQIGIPFESEFVIEDPENVELYRDDDTVCIRMSLRSPRFPQAVLHATMKLFSSGIVERQLELVNEGDKPIELQVMDIFWNRSYEKVLPTRDGIVHSTPDNVDDDCSWEYDSFAEPWAWFEEEGVTRALIWNSDEPVKKTSWDWFIEYAPGELQPGQSWRSKPVTMALNVFSHWSEARDYAMGRQMKKEMPHSACSVEVDTAFVEKIAHAHAWWRSYEDIGGEWCIESEDGVFAPASAKMTEVGKPTDFDLTPTRPFAVERLQATLHSSVWKGQRSVALFGMNGQVTTGEEEREGHKIWWADNGVLRIAAAPEFLPGIISLKHNGEEWLDTSFPKPIARGWWKPWCGGLYDIPEMMTLIRALGEEATARHVQVADSAGVVWRGLRIDVTVKEHEPCKGLGWSQYFMLAPGAPALLHITRIEQNTGRYLHMNLKSRLYLRGLDGACEAEIPDGKGNISRLTTGDRMNSIPTPRLLRFNHPETSMLHLHALESSLREAFSSSEMLIHFASQNEKMATGQTHTLRPNWLVFTDKRFTIDELRPLETIELQWETEQ